MEILELFQNKNIPLNLGANGWHKDSGIAAVYPPLESDDLSWLQSQLIQSIPDLYTQLLTRTNGLFFKNLTIFGIPVKQSKSLDRSKLLPQSVITANQAWRLKYKMSDELLMVGSKSGWSENTGIFMSQNGSLVAVNSEATLKIESIEQLFDWGQDA